jgi:two-component sensor histidine kinase
MAGQPPLYAEEAALSLTMALVTSSSGPLILLDGAFRVVAVSDSFCEAFEIDCATAAGRPMTSLGSGEWDLPQLHSLLDATASGAARIEAYEIYIRPAGRATRCLVLHAQRLAYLDLENPRLLVAVSDVTEARADAKAKDDALRQNLVLLQEVRHRVANSLQIIASVLLHNAKQTASDETRGHLKDAHNRVMSVAALERQLSVSGEREVELRAYFVDLCASIGASMIADADQVSLQVTGPGGTVDSRVSVSLGLIVTELAINALKHAFPDGRTGRIVVDCAVRSPNWTLSVTDDGVGMRAGPGEVRVGLGTSIVQALARQLEAVVVTSPAHPGTRVALSHSPIVLVGQADGPDAARAAVPPRAAREGTGS